jgi:hypothetical protein
MTWQRGISFFQFIYVTEKVVPAANFSVDAFFYFLFVMMAFSFAAFALMDLLPSMKNFHDSDDDVRSEDRKRCYKIFAKIFLGPSPYFPLNGGHNQCI